jgi:hypothetical protein
LNSTFQLPPFSGSATFFGEPQPLLLFSKPFSVLFVTDAAF